MPWKLVWLRLGSHSNQQMPIRHSAGPSSAAAAAPGQRRLKSSWAHAAAAAAAARWRWRCWPVAELQ